MTLRAVLLAISLYFACSLAGAQTPQSGAASASPVLFPGMDPTVRPGNDFFDYANGGWLKGVQIPADRASFGTFEELDELNQKRVADLIRKASAQSQPHGSAARKVADFYAAFMDEKMIEARGQTALRPALARIDAIPDAVGLARYLGGTLRADVDMLNLGNTYTDNLFGLWVAQDLDQPSRYLPFLIQGGLGMPDRDYYLGTSSAMSKAQMAYQKHIVAMLKLIGETNADAKGAAIYSLEHSIALVHASRTDTEDPKRGDNHWTREKFRNAAPGMDWDAYFAAAGLKDQSDFVVWQPGAAAGIAKLVGGTPVATWKAYLKYHLADHFAGVLPSAFVDEHFAFFGKALYGTPQLAERWKRGVARTNATLGDAVGQLYVKQYFSAAAKARIEALVRNLIAAFAARIDALEWMTPQTRVKAKAKLATLKVGVGYPDHWVDYSALKIERDDAFGNAVRAEEFDYRRNLNKLGKPVDRSEWVMVAQTINAVNLPAMNALNFPAGILQPPFFDPSQPDAMNYGGIGATIGHEISHSFDNQGAEFDATGHLTNWWTPEDFAHFKAASAMLVSQFNGYQPFPDLHVNGELTLSENIADVAGLAAAYSAFELSRKGVASPSIRGFSADQQFFLSFARAWRGTQREEAERERITTDGHSPRRYRAFTVRNNAAWYAAFGVTQADKLYLAPDKRVRIW